MNIFDHFTSSTIVDVSKKIASFSLLTSLVLIGAAWTFPTAAGTLFMGLALTVPLLTISLGSTWLFSPGTTSWTDYRVPHHKETEPPHERPTHPVTNISAQLVMPQPHPIPAQATVISSPITTVFSSPQSAHNHLRNQEGLNFHQAQTLLRQNNENSPLPRAQRHRRAPSTDFMHNPVPGLPLSATASPTTILRSSGVPSNVGSPLRHQSVILSSGRGLMETTTNLSSARDTRPTSESSPSSPTSRNGRN